MFAMPAAANAASPAPVQSAVPAPDVLVRSLYSPYLKGGDQDKSAIDNDAERDRRFSKETAKLFRAYYKTQEKADEPGGLDFDPIVNAQDFDIKALDVRADKIVPGKTAVVIVTFKNFDEASKLKYALVFESGEWKVDNIDSLYDPVWDLRDLLKGG
jgi:hypothetical protein